jgi:hypothetical protein
MKYLIIIVPKISDRLLPGAQIHLTVILLHNTQPPTTYKEIYPTNKSEPKKSHATIIAKMNVPVNNLER